MLIYPQTAIGYCWGTLGFVWLLGLARLKRTVHSQPAGPRLFHFMLAALGFGLLGGSYFAIGWLGSQVVPQTAAIGIGGVVLTVAGCFVAAWARVTIGANWSGRATVKAGHELITRGPYALARHPIYSGLLLASVGTAIVFGQARCFLGLVLIVLALVVKMSQEEQLMLQAFPHAYPAYRMRVKALIPGIF